MTGWTYGGDNAYPNNPTTPKPLTMKKRVINKELFNRGRDDEKYNRYKTFSLVKDFKNVELSQFGIGSDFRTSRSVNNAGGPAEAH